MRTEDSLDCQNPRTKTIANRGLSNDVNDQKLSTCKHEGGIYD
ncbi:MAG: hypothetical protein PWP45_1872 [Tepidanaerobacteraceae bacterium]|nr:hypothetical protein [Tepidanaerobacteraceae bacterium]